ncbi:MAG: hypothetical protein ACREJC_07625, partial [Tepidisphaeraceae bacterium]
VLVDAREVILLLLGHKWEGAIPIFRIFTICAFAASAGMVARWVYLAEGMTRRQLAWACIATPVLVTSVIIGLPRGAIGVAYSYATATCLLAFPGLWFCFSASVLKLSDFAQAVWRPALNALCIVLVLSAVRWMWPTDGLLLAFIRDGLIGGVVSVACWTITRSARHDLRQMIGLLHRLRPRKPEELIVEDGI